MRAANAKSADLVERATARSNSLAKQLAVAKDTIVELRRKEQRFHRYVGGSPLKVPRSPGDGDEKQGGAPPTP